MRIALCAALLGAAAAQADPEPPGETQIREAVAACLDCHLLPGGEIDIVGLGALEGLPPEWAFLYEDAFDLDGDGIAGAIRIVPGVNGPAVATLGEALAASRFEDFAIVAGKAHGVDVSDPAVMAAVKVAFYLRSPEPDLTLHDDAALSRFESRGCSGCHVTRTFEQDGRTYRPLSDFLLHDLGDGPVRTAPLWGCLDCLDAPGHGLFEPRMD